MNTLAQYKTSHTSTLTQLASALCAEILSIVTPQANDCPGIDMSSSYRKCISLTCSYQTRISNVSKQRHQAQPKWIIDLTIMTLKLMTVKYLISLFNLLPSSLLSNYKLSLALKHYQQYCPRLSYHEFYRIPRKCIQHRGLCNVGQMFNSFTELLKFGSILPCGHHEIKSTEFGFNILYCSSILKRPSRN